MFVLGRNLFNFAMNSYPKVADKLKNVATERKKKNYEAKQEVIDLLEAVEVKKDVDLVDLDGTPLLGKKQSSLAKSVSSSDDKFKEKHETLSDRMKLAEAGLMSTRYVELKDEVRQLKSTTLMLSM